MLFPCSGGSLFGKAFGSEVVVLPVVIPKRNRRCKGCISKPNRGAQWAQVKKRASWVRQAMLLRCFEGCVLGSLVFFIGSGRNVWHWRSPQHRSKNGVIELARPCCFPVPEAAFLGRLLGQKSWFCRSWYPNATEGTNGVFRRQLEVQIAPQSCKTSFFYRFWMRRLTLKITQRRSKNGVLEFARPCCFPVPEAAFLGRLLGQKSWFCPLWRPNATEGANGVFRRQLEVQIAPHSCKNLLFLKILDATFDIEDHSNAGRKTVSLSSPGHAVSLFRRQPFWEGFWVRSRGFAGRDIQTQPKVPTVYFEGNWRCKLHPKAAKPSFFIDSGCDVWHWRSPQRRSKNGVLEFARPCCFPVPEAAFLGRLLGQKSWFCRWEEGVGGNGRQPLNPAAPSLQKI